MAGLYYINQVINLAENNALNLDSDSVLAGLDKLYSILTSLAPQWTQKRKRSA